MAIENWLKFSDSNYPLSECVPLWLTHQIYRYLHYVISIQLTGKSMYSTHDVGDTTEQLSSEQLSSRELRRRRLQYFIETELSYLLVNEILFDLYYEYKNNESSFKPKQQIINKILLIYEKYSDFINARIYKFEHDLSQLVRKMRKEKIKIDKIKRIPLVFEPVKITVDIRYAIIKRADRKCEGCGVSILERPIDVYQVRTGDEQGAMTFIGYCNACKEQNNERIISVQNG